MESNVHVEDLPHRTACDEAADAHVGTAERTLCTLALFFGSAMVIAALILAIADGRW